MPTKRWLEFEQDAYRFMNASMHKKIPADTYKVESDNSGAYLVKHEISQDKLYLVEDTIADEITREIKDFWSRKEAYDKLEVVHKRGFLVWGPPGTGKTSMMNMLAKWVIEQDGLVIYGSGHPYSLISVLESIREIEPDRPVAVFLEDFEEIVDGNMDWEHAFLGLLDGEHSIGNIVYIATSNYPEKLDPRFIDRPSRFDVIKYLGKPNMNFITVFIKDKFKDEPLIAEELISKSSELTIAQLKEVIIRIRIFDVSVDDAIAVVGMSVKDKLTPPKGEKVVKKSKSMGFSSGQSDRALPYDGPEEPYVDKKAVEAYRDKKYKEFKKR